MKQRPEPRYVGVVHLFVYPSSSIAGTEYACIITRGLPKRERDIDPLRTLERMAWCSCPGYENTKKCWHVGDAWKRAEDMEAIDGGLQLLYGGGESADETPERPDPPLKEGT